jgi:alcohol dehydrogenase class IV
MGLAADNEGDQAAVARLLNALEQCNKDLGVPSPCAHGIDKARWDALLPLMAQQALDSGSPGNNPRVPSAEEIVELYRSAWT